MRKIDSIILHCSATRFDQDFKASDIDKWHRHQGWKCIGYHFVIDIDGTIENGRNIEMIGAHCVGKNTTSIGICYIGGLDHRGAPSDTRTSAQRESLVKLVRELMEKYDIPLKNVHCHNEYAKKACPCFNRNTFIYELTNS